MRASRQLGQPPVDCVLGSCGDLKSLFQSNTTGNNYEWNKLLWDDHQPALSGGNLSEPAFSGILLDFQREIV